MAIIHTLFDPLTRKAYNYITDSTKEEHLLSVLDAALYNRCPTDTSDYLCEKSDIDEGNELLQCAKCFQLWAKKVTGADSAKAKKLLEAIDLATHDECPPESKDMICKASEDESTDEETCAKCIQRWATIQFATFRK